MSTKRTKNFEFFCARHFGVVIGRQMCDFIQYSPSVLLALLYGLSVLIQTCIQLEFVKHILVATTHDSRRDLKDARNTSLSIHDPKSDCVMECP